MRTVPVVGTLRDLLLDHRAAVAGDRGHYVFPGREPSNPFTPTAVYRRADTAWKKAKLTKIRPHECRHTFASLSIAAGVNVKALSTMMGHSSVAFTLDRHGHLMPGGLDEAAALLDGYLERAAQFAAAS